MTLTWLTQSGYLLEHEGYRLVIDPYLSDAGFAKGCTRVVPAPIDAEALASDCLVCTHDHVDHWDPVGAPEILRRHPRCVLLAPMSVRLLARTAGLSENRMRSLDLGEEQLAGPFRISALPTLHSDPCGVGLLVRAGPWAFYHSGDTEYSTALAKELAKRPAVVTPHLDVAALCINGRLGNQTWEEAALIAERLRPRLCVPNHYDLFSENLANPQPFLSRCRERGLDASTLVPGVPSTLPVSD